VNLSVDWPDIAIAVILAVAAIKGIARGFVMELGGILAVVAGFAAAFYYNGILDGWLHHTFKLDVGTSHVIGMIVCGCVAYIATLAALYTLGLFAKIPGLGTLNAAGGAVVGAAKGCIFLWAVLFVALLFPLPRQVRFDLHRSKLVGILTQQDGRIDDAIYAKLPDEVKPFVKPLFDRRRF
jgi:uncharacterized membrane protein required for colicin V production